MIKNFETVKKQLRELAGVINPFKSEAVQLRIIELIFGIIPGEEVQHDDNQKEGAPSPKKARRKKKASPKPNDKTSKPKKKLTTAGSGAVATLNKLSKTDFFSKPKTISDIIEYCSTNHARKFKANEFSSKLGRMVREKELTRKKNADRQYEYTKA